MSRLNHLSQNALFWYISLAGDTEKILSRAGERKEGRGHFVGHIYCCWSADYLPWCEAAGGPATALPWHWIFFQLSYCLARCVSMCVFSNLGKGHVFCKITITRSVAIKMHTSFSPLLWSSNLFSWNSSKLVSFSSRLSALGTLGSSKRCGGSLVKTS